MNFELELLIADSIFRMIFISGRGKSTETHGLWRVSSGFLGQSEGYWRLVYSGDWRRPFKIEVLTTEYISGFLDAANVVFFNKSWSDEVLTLHDIQWHPLFPAGAHGRFNTGGGRGAMLPRRWYGTWRVTKPPDYSPMTVTTPEWYKKGGTGRARI